MYNTFLNSINKQSGHMYARDVEGKSMQNYLLSKESIDLAQFNLRYPVGFEVESRGAGSCKFTVVVVGSAFQTTDAQI